MELRRRQTDDILRDLEKKMVIIVGPRQVGKTWIAKEVMRHFSRTLYLNWDSPEDRAVIKSGKFPEGLELIVFDEIHKMRMWKNFIKGIYDTRPPSLRILITGSARLHALKRMGDSMTGRYFAHHVLPLSPAEVKWGRQEYTLDHFLTHGGFPEPFLATNDIDVARWRNQYVESNIRGEVLDFAVAQDLAALTDIVKLLRTKVGSPISFKSIAEDVGISPITARRYVQIFEDLHLVFSVRTFTKKVARAILKEPKIYFYDTGLVTSPEAQLENLVALSLIKQVKYLQDTQGIQGTLAYLRTKDNREVDFALVRDNVLQEIIEVKTSDTQPSSTLRYFGERQNVPMTQVVKEMRHAEIVSAGVRVVRLKEYLEGLVV